MQEDEVVDGGEVKGFTIRCKGIKNEDEDVIVSDADAKVMSRNCEYFQNVFAHGTREAEERVILKPDWASSTAKQLVKLITTGKMTLTIRPRERESFHLLVEAAQQLLLDLSFRFRVMNEQHISTTNLAQVETFLNLYEILDFTAHAHITLNRSSSTCVRAIAEEQ